MKNLIRYILIVYNYNKWRFMLKYIGLVALLFLFVTSSYAAGNVKEYGKFGDWQVSCEQTSTNAKDRVCYVSQSLTANDKNSKKTYHIAHYRIGYYSGKNKPLELHEIISYEVGDLSGLFLPIGTSVIADKAIIAKGSYVIANTTSCIANAQITKKELDVMIKAKDLSMAIIRFSDKKQINIQISNKGLRAAMNKLSKLQ